MVIILFLSSAHSQSWKPIVKKGRDKSIFDKRRDESIFDKRRDESIFDKRKVENNTIDYRYQSIVLSLGLELQSEKVIDYRDKSNRLP